MPGARSTLDWSPMTSPMTTRHSLIAAALMLIAGCTAAPRAPLGVAEMPNVSTEMALADIKKLSSDEFEGRLPGTKGEQLAVDYITRQMSASGLEPGNPN